MTLGEIARVAWVAFGLFLLVAALTFGLVVIAEVGLWAIQALEGLTVWRYVETDFYGVTGVARWAVESLSPDFPRSLAVIAIGVQASLAAMWGYRMFQKAPGL